LPTKTEATHSEVLSTWTSCQTMCLCLYLCSL